MKYLELVPLKQSKQLSKQNLWTFDCETKDGLKGAQLYCWSLATNSGGNNREVKVYSGKTIDSFFKTLIELNNPNKKQIIYVHNLSFDCRFLIDYCIRKKLSFKPIYANSNVILFYISDLNFKFIDSFQFLLSTQEKAEITYNVPKELTKIDCSDLFKSDFKKWTDSDKKRVLEHNKNDVLALQFILKRFREQMYENANVDLLQCNTLAGLSLKAFRKCMQSAIVNPYINVNFDLQTKKYNYILQDEKYHFAKSAYFGGRTECFNHALVKNVKYFDKVSMFPAQMKFQLFPKGIPYWEKDSNKIAGSLTDKLSIIEARMIPNYKEKYPVLPFRKENKTIFGNFNEVGIWTSIEIKYAISRGYQFKFLRALIFPESFNPFSDFIDKFFTIKQKSVGSVRQIAKIILNSCYGKFGQRVEQIGSDTKFFDCESEAIEFYENKIDNDEKAFMEYNECYKRWSVRFSESRTQLQSFQIVHLSAFITAYARIELLKGIHELTDNSIPVYYCDTDSIVTIDNSILNLGKELGCWDIECTFDEFKCIAPKCYLAKFENSLIIKVKGIRKDKIKSWVKEYSTIESVLPQLEQTIELEAQYLPVKSALLREKSALAFLPSSKKLSLIDSKRKVLENADTLPLSDT